MSQGVKLASLPARSFMNLIFYRLTRDMDQESLDEFRLSLERIQYNFETEREKLVYVPEAPSEEVEEEEEKPAGTPWNTWVMPEGWTPPGWDPEGSMRAATEFMGFNTNPK